jgi:hypothetical protein
MSRVRRVDSCGFISGSVFKEYQRPLVAKDFVRSNSRAVRNGVPILILLTDVLKRIGILIHTQMPETAPGTASRCTQLHSASVCHLSNSIQGKRAKGNKKCDYHLCQSYAPTVNYEYTQRMTCLTFTLIDKITINVPVVNMAREVMILMGANPFRGPTEGPWHSLCLFPFQGPKKSQFSGPNTSNVSSCRTVQSVFTLYRSPGPHPWLP